jgi:hypothetical protein
VGSEPVLDRRWIDSSRITIPDIDADARSLRRTLPRLRHTLSQHRAEHVERAAPSLQWAEFTGQDAFTNPRKDPVEEIYGLPLVGH